ncbi:MAG: hypothetical protein IKO41_00450 [Lachnospiraceae bacterium]|nr:hypothetical protein [Lachnospiraceae bacterium]
MKFFLYGGRERAAAGVSKICIALLYLYYFFEAIKIVGVFFMVLSLDFSSNFKCNNSKSPSLSINEAFEFQDKFISILSLSPHLIKNIKEEEAKKYLELAERGLILYTYLNDDKDALLCEAFISTFSKSTKCDMLSKDRFCKLQHFPTSCSLLAIKNSSKKSFPFKDQKVKVECWNDNFI